MTFQFYFHLFWEHKTRNLSRRFDECICLLFNFLFFIFAWIGFIPSGEYVFMLFRREWDESNFRNISPIHRFFFEVIQINFRTISGVYWMESVMQIGNDHLNKIFHNIWKRKQQQLNNKNNRTLHWKLLLFRNANDLWMGKLYYYLSENKSNFPVHLEYRRALNIPSKVCIEWVSVLIVSDMRQEH